MTIAKTFTARRQLRRRETVETAHGSSSTMVPNGYETAQVEITVDMQAIADQIATRAMGSSRGLSKFMHGAIVARVITRRKEG